MKTISIKTKSNTHSIKDGVLSVKSDRLLPVRGIDGKMVLRYFFDLSLTIPKGVIGLVLPPNELSMLSIDHVGSFIFLPGVIEEPFIDFKLNTDVIPTVLEKEDIVANIIFLNAVLDADIKVETIIAEDDAVETKNNANDEVPLGTTVDPTSIGNSQEEGASDSDDGDRASIERSDTEELPTEVSGQDAETTESNELEKEAVQQ